MEDHAQLLTDRNVALLEEWNCMLQNITPPTKFVRTIADLDHRDTEVVNLLIDKAHQHLKYGLIFISAFPWWAPRVHLACIWPLCFALKTLEISRDNVKVLGSKIKITRKTFMFGWSDRWLRVYVNLLGR
jgi:hypothetical protein